MGEVFTVKDSRLVGSEISSPRGTAAWTINCVSTLQWYTMSKQPDDTAPPTRYFFSPIRSRKRRMCQHSALVHYEQTV
jgi:hypothetical protein